MTPPPPHMYIYRTLGGTMEPPPRCLLPVDLLLEIAARSDAATVVRMAAASKPLRRGILEPTFLRRLADVVVGKGRRHVPSLTVAWYWIPESFRDYFDDPYYVGTSRPGLHRLKPSLLLWYRSFLPACSRDGLLVLRKDYYRGDWVRFCVFDTSTGSVTDVPGPDGYWGKRSTYCPALITVDGAGRHFELILLHRYWRMQTFSSRTGKWGAARSVKSPLGRRRTTWMTADEESFTAPVVIGRTVYWICDLGNCLGGPQHHEGVVVLALHVDDTAHATVIKLPTILSTTPNPFKSLILATTKEGRLSVAVAGYLAISVWTMAQPDQGPAGSWSAWSLQIVIDRRLTAGLVPCTAVRFEWFAERTGTVLLVMDGLGLVEIDLRTKDATVLRCDATDVRGACLHEIDVVSLLNNMRPFVFSFRP
jgi:hypothetical protein